MDESTADPVLTSLAALAPVEAEVADGFLIAAVYLRAMRTDRSPRDVLDALWKSMPAGDAWPGLRDALAELLLDE